MSESGEPLGVVLAGGRGRRMGGAKALVELAHRPLISYPLEAMWRALGNVAIVAKTDTRLPELTGAVVWVEPDEPRHPLTGIVHALGLAGARPVVVCAADMPLITSELIGAIAAAPADGRPAVVASLGGELQPLLARYEPGALAPLSAALRRPQIPLREAVAALAPARFEMADPECLFNVNSPAELLQAAALLDRRRSPA